MHGSSALKLDEYNQGMESFLLNAQSKSLQRFYSEFWSRLDGQGCSGSTDLSLLESRLLRFVNSQGPARMCEISEFLSYPTSTLTYMADRLVKRGYLERRRDKNDRRSIRLHLTQQAETYLEKRQGRVTELCKKALGGLSEMERKQLSMIIGKVVAAI